MSRVLEKDNFDYKLLGLACKRFRKDHGYRLRDIADEVGVTEGMISHFEHGKADSARVLFWYVSRGLNVNCLEGVTDYV